jgi:hypothetical protein
MTADSWRLVGFRDAGSGFLPTGFEFIRQVEEHTGTT